MKPVNTAINQQLSQLYKEQSGKVLATLVRLLGDFELAEEAMHEAFSVALDSWGNKGIPANPTPWLISTARFKAIDTFRRNKRFSELEADVQRLINELEEYNHEVSTQEIEDDQLRMIFTCCHPAIDPKIQIPLTLREVCGLSTEEIASAYLVSPSTMAQRIVRGKNKIQKAKIPFVIPEITELPERLEGVLLVIYLVFNEGYAASNGDSLLRVDLSNEAIRLARLVLSLLPDSEVMGLLALMLLHESRRYARTDADGNIILLEDQDRSLWLQTYIDEGMALVQQAFTNGQVGSYTLQAAIAAEYAKSTGITDWNQVIRLYSLLLQVEPSPVVELNRAVAIAMRDGEEAGLKIIDSILASGALQDYHKLHSTRGELLVRSGQISSAIAAFEQALVLVKQAPEKRFLVQKLAQLKSQ
ncbi:RNA polymerase sigma factor [Planctobacterium marinum]|uniref:RNA polymerase sigma factor n=1 Tax=Planctobacterium marinum TaxID=1631968 RepID=UPI001E38F898|nr:RNA polymerase sigma factor [Planctobacterium marinum]MCC2606782.1 RNA polymerase sigma factor [Planctobacterium marinum]